MVRSLLNRQRSMILGSIIPLLFACSYIVNSTTGTVLAAAPTCSSWSAVSTGQTGLSDLCGITAISSSDLWAVGLSVRKWLP